MATAKERAQFLAVLTREFPERGLMDIERIANSIMRNARTHGSLCVAECNGPPSNDLADEWEQHVSKRKTAVIGRLRDLAAELGVRMDLGGDPRGYTVKIHLPSGASNTWGGRECGWGVPQ